MNEQKKFTDWIKENTLLSIESVKIHSNPNMEYDPKNDQSHFECTITYRDESSFPVITRERSFFYSQGSAHEGKKPKLIDVLYCLVSDSQGVEDRTFEDWASEYGYSTDSRIAENTFKAILENNLKLKFLLGLDLFNEVMSLEMDY